jgi:hypothetical protein
LANELNRGFLKEEVQVAKKKKKKPHMKKCSLSLFIKEMQIKTILTFHLPLMVVNMATIKNTNNNKHW